MIKKALVLHLKSGLILGHDEHQHYPNFLKEDPANMGWGVLDVRSLSL